MPAPDLSGRFVDTQGDTHMTAAIGDVKVQHVVEVFESFVELYPGIGDLGTVEVICKNLVKAVNVLDEKNIEQRLQVLSSRTEGSIDLYNPNDFAQEPIYKYNCPISI